MVPGRRLYGQDAISAVINIKTRSPGDVMVEALGGYGLDDMKEWYASFTRTFFKQSDLPISVTGYVAAGTRDLSNFREDYPAWWQKYDDYLGPIGRAGPPEARRLRPQRLRPAGVQTHLAAGLVPRERAQQLGGQRRGRRQTGAVLRARGPLARPLTGGRGATRAAFSDSVTLHSILTFNRYEVDPDSRYVFPNGMGGLFLEDYKYAIGTSASLEEKLDIRLGSRARLVVGAVATNYDIIPKTTVETARPSPGGT